MGPIMGNAGLEKTGIETTFNEYATAAKPKPCDSHIRIEGQRF